MDDNKHKNQHTPAWQLPDQPKPYQTDYNKAADPAADLIRRRVEAAYLHEPAAEQEASKTKATPAAQRSKHQQVIYDLTNSGRPLHDIQTAWHEYYSGLLDDEKHQVWQEFYASHAETSQHPAITKHEPITQPHQEVLARPVSMKPNASRQIAKLKKAGRPATSVKKSAARQSLHSLLFGLGVGSIVMLVFMFGFFNDRIIAPFIQPSRSITNIPLIASSGAVGPQPEIIIPKINAQLPVVYNPAATNDKVIQKDLQNGVAHYAGTAMPGQNGNVVIVGHSSNNILNPGKYKFAFVLLHKLTIGDTFYLNKDGRRYTYQVYKRLIVSPDQVSVLGPAEKPATATLITCDPPGTSINRLVVTAEQIDPSPSGNLAATNPSAVTAATNYIPGNAPSLWSRITGWFVR